MSPIRRLQLQVPEISTLVIYFKKIEPRSVLEVSLTPPGFAGHIRTVAWRNDKTVLYQADEGVYPTAIHYVGRYALQFVWSDGHSTGIYPFEYLRKKWDADQA